MSISKVRERLKELERQADTEIEDADAYYEAGGILNIDIDIGLEE